MRSYVKKICFFDFIFFLSFYSFKNAENIYSGSFLRQKKAQVFFKKYNFQIHSQKNLLIFKSYF